MKLFKHPKTKPNWKYILIVVALAIIVGGGFIGIKARGQKDNTQLANVAICTINPQTGEEECTWDPGPRELVQPYTILKYLVPIFFFILILIWLNKKIVPRWKSERKKKIAKIFIKIFLVIFIIAFIGFFLLLVASISGLTL